MTFDDLVHFLESKMSMRHVYQPLLVRSLLDAGGSATVRQLAQVFLSQDESQLLFYEKTLKRMPVPVLKRHGVVKVDGSLVTLNVGSLKFEQKARIRSICEKKLHDFVAERGLSLWDYRLLDDNPVPGSLRFQVLKEANGRCALCGATKDDRPLDVDHIIPRSRRGKTSLDNLQALCSKCNRSKSNKDETDFRPPLQHRDDGCPFCLSSFREGAVEDNGHVFAVHDKFPVTKGHLLVVPHRHTSDWFDMTALEREQADELVRVMRKRLQESDRAISGFNIGMNCGRDAGQTVMHAHIHLIPRRHGDVAKPEGGVRGVIPSKAHYQ